MNNFFKGFVAVITCVCLFLCFPFSAQASSFYSDNMNTWDLLDYDAISYPRGNHVTVVGDHTFSWDVPVYRALGYVDILCSIGGNTDGLSAFLVRPSGATTELNVEHISGYMYRIYGSVPFHTASKFDLRITSSSQVSRVFSFFSVNLSAGESIYDMAGKLEVFSSAGDYSSTWDAGERIQLDMSSITSNHDFIAYFYPYKWELYDFIYLTFEYSGLDPYSLYVSLDGVPVPFTYDYISEDSDNHRRKISIKIDVSGLNRDIGGVDHIPIKVLLDSAFTKDNSFIVVDNCFGGLVVPEPSKFRIFTDKIGSWFQSIFDKLDDLLSGSAEDQAAADSFQESIDDQASQFEDMSDTMNQVPRPGLEDFDFSSNNMVDSNSVILATNGLGSILQNPIILNIILMALTLALAGFVLYGKR